MNPAIIYSSMYTPDRTRAEDVFAFLLVPEAAFVQPDDCKQTRNATFALIREAKRDALLYWYKHHMRSKAEALR